MLGGWYADAGHGLPDGNEEFLVYLGSYYGSPDAAAAAFNDAAAGWSSVSPVVCSWGSQCAQVTVPLMGLNGAQYDGIFRMVQKSNSIFEAGYFLPSGTAAQEAATAGPYLDGLTQAYLNIFNPPAAPTPTPAPPVTTPAPTTTPTPAPTATPTQAPAPAVDFTLLAVRVEKYRSQPDVHLVTAPLKKVKIDTKVYLSAYVVVRSAPPGAVMTGDFVVTTGGKTVLQRSVSAAASGSSSEPTRLLVTFKPSKVGKYLLTVKVTVGDQTQTQTASFKVVA